MQIEKIRVGLGVVLLAVMGQVQAAEDRGHRGAMGGSAMHQQICKGKKAGETVQLQRGDHTMQGKCQLGFIPQQPVSANVERQDREQMRAAREAQNKACSKFKVGQTININDQGKKIAGKCDLVFQPQR